jgi:hypothetical protein
MLQNTEILKVCVKFNSLLLESNIVVSEDCNAIEVHLGYEEDKHRNSTEISASININESVLEIKSIETDVKC